MMHKMMLTAAVLITAAVNGQQKFTVKGTVMNGYPATSAIIGYEEGGRYVTDTAVIKNGSFSFSAVVSRPPLAQVTLLAPRSNEEPTRGSDNNGEQEPKNIALFYPEGEMRVVFDSSGKANVSGGGKEDKAHRAFTAFGKENAAKGEKALPFEQMVAAFIRKYPDAYMSLDLLEMFAGAIQPATFEPMLTSLSSRMRKTEKAKRWAIQLKEAKQFDVGRPTVNFTLNDTAGAPLSLSSFHGRYVLLDFWASWCGPCRAGHPELIKIYDQFKSEKFDILAVSLDNNKKAWVKAINEDKLPWKLVIDSADPSGSVAKTYHISQIPQNLLIDPKGVIIGRNLSGKNLEDKLSNILQ